MSQNRLQLLLTLLLPLTGCGEADPLPDICSRSPALCRDLVDDGWCRAERRQVILARHAAQGIPAEPHYRLLEALDGYLKCMDHASKLEYRLLKDKKSRRIESMLSASQQQETLDEQTRDSSNPWLAMWHWQRHADHAAGARFMALAGTPALEQGELQEALAIETAKHEPKRAMALFEHALTLPRQDNHLPVRIATALSTLHMGLKHYREAYLWAVVAAKLPDGPNVSAQRMSLYITITADERSAIEAKAQEIADAINDGHYSP